MKRSSRARLSPRQLDEFPSDTLRDRLGRAVCRAACLPRKEFFESWEAARRVRRTYRGGRILELAAGHGLLSMMLLVLDHSSESAVCVDRTQPPSFDRLLAELSATWPHLQGRISWLTADLATVEPGPDDLVVSVHACGSLSDQVLDAALRGRARVAVMPCCHDLELNDAGPLAGWMDGPLAIDAMRALRLQTAGYEVKTLAIPGDITPKNRLLIGRPED